MKKTRIKYEYSLLLAMPVAVFLGFYWCQTMFNIDSEDGLPQTQTRCPTVSGSNKNFIASKDQAIVDSLLDSMLGAHSGSENQIPSTGEGLFRPYIVPNIVHYIWFGKDRSLTFINYVSMRSAYFVQKPEKIFIHCDHLPVGVWWQKLQEEVPLVIKQQQRPQKLGSQLIGPEMPVGIHSYGYFHQADVAKLEILIEYGGIYMDCDVIVINSLNPLRIHEVAIAREKPPKLIMGTILAAKNASFLRVWYETYKYTYDSSIWDYNTGIVSFYMFTRRPDLIHVEPFRMSTPDWTERTQLLFKTIINWRSLFVLHFMGHRTTEQYNVERMNKMQNTLGEVLRHGYNIGRS